MYLHFIRKSFLWSYVTKPIFDLKIKKNHLAGLKFLLVQQDHRPHPLFILQNYPTVHTAYISGQQICLSTLHQSLELNFGFFLLNLIHFGVLLFPNFLLQDHRQLGLFTFALATSTLVGSMQPSQVAVSTKESDLPNTP